MKNIIKKYHVDIVYCVSMILIIVLVWKYVPKMIYKFVYEPMVIETIKETCDLNHIQN